LVQLSRRSINPDLHTHVALVTGGSRGIGAAIALAFAGAVAAVAVNYRERAGDAEAIVERIRGHGGRAVTIGADVSRREPVAEMIARIAAELGPVDVLVNHAGIGLVRGLDDLTSC
jgi:3-oxoacyl-[acyl-carrier protein] reductase